MNLLVVLLLLLAASGQLQLALLEALCNLALALFVAPLHRLHLCGLLCVHSLHQGVNIVLLLLVPDGNVGCPEGGRTDVCGCVCVWVGVCVSAYALS